MLEKSTAPGHPLHWFLFGLVVYVSWILMDMISIVPGMVFALGPLLFLVATCVIVMPELRSRKTETKQVRRRFLCTISGGFVGALVGVALKYSI